MKAMILAAGRGERMGALTDHTPKPLLEAGGRPLIEHQIARLADAGFRDVVVNLAWLGERIAARLGDGSRLGVRIRYSREPEGALDTGGGIRQALPLLGGERFAAVNSDVWSDYPLEKLRDATAGDAHVVLVDNPPHNPEGDFGLAPDGRVTGAKDTVAGNVRAMPASASPPIPEGGAAGPASDERDGGAAHGRLTFSGIGCYHPRLFSDRPIGRFPLVAVLRDAIDAGTLSGEHHRGEWADVGTPERLDALDRRLRAGRPV